MSVALKWLRTRLTNSVNYCAWGATLCMRVSDYIINIFIKLPYIWC